MRLQRPALGINPFDLAEADIGCRKRIPHECAVTGHGLMDRANVAAGLQHDFSGYPRFDC